MITSGRMMDGGLFLFSDDIASGGFINIGTTTFKKVIVAVQQDGEFDWFYGAPLKETHSHSGESPP